MTQTIASSLELESRLYENLARGAEGALAKGKQDCCNLTKRPSCLISYTEKELGTTETGGECGAN